LPRALRVPRNDKHGERLEAETSKKAVIPAKAGIRFSTALAAEPWIPAFASMTTNKPRQSWERSEAISVV
jgi:hypothetical protein